MLRTAEAVGLSRRIEHRLRPVRKSQPVQRAFETRTLVRRGHREHAALALDHDRPDIAERRADQGDPRGRIGHGHFAHPFRTGPCLAEAAAREQQPDRPVAFGRKLFLARLDPPMPLDPAAVLLIKLAQRGEPFRLFHLDQGFKQVGLRLRLVRAASAPP